MNVVKSNEKNLARKWKGSEGCVPYCPAAAINMGAFPVGRVDEGAGAELIEG